MLKRDQQPALLANLIGPHLPPVALNVSARYQFCVDAGACAAVDFFDDLAAVGLHDHIALSLQAFNRSLRAAARQNPEFASIGAQACTDAFAAGYLGRIQQELRLFHGEATLGPKAPNPPGGRAVSPSDTLH
ncbi:hypothetical protein [Undibacterium terreum]|uniref:Uncharacterized protein n=1 Tax=Undibacterium terreum TaxID=1224302 RepID=A0A916V0E1_9BURK|nr:hypothetical protein [Undibacterium terreum]GGC98725.1 hypothetical protein GCM10011396_52820 [Undibacterium terreum]